MSFKKMIEEKGSIHVMARALFITAMLFFACSTETVLADVTGSGSGSFSGSNQNGSPGCGSAPYLLIHFFPVTDGVSCSFVTYKFQPVTDGDLTITITPTGSLNWGRYGYPEGTPGLFATLGPYNDINKWSYHDVVRYDVDTVTQTIPVQANQTYYLFVGYGDWVGIGSPTTFGSFNVYYTLPTPPQPPAVDEDVPLPLWAIIALGAGLLGIGQHGSRRIGRLQ